MNKIDVLFAGEKSILFIQNIFTDKTADRFGIASTHGIDAESVLIDDPSIFDEWIDQAGVDDLEGKTCADLPFCSPDLPSRSDQALIIPLESAGKKLGLIWAVPKFANESPRGNPADQREFGKIVSKIIHYAIELRKNQFLSWTTSFLMQVMETSQSIENIEDLLRTMVTFCFLITGVQKCGFFLYDPASELLTHSYSRGFPFQKGESIPLDENASLQTVISSKHALIDLRTSDDQVSTKFLGTEPDTCLNVYPLLEDTKILGLLVVSINKSLSPEKQAGFYEETLSLMNGIANQTSSAVTRLRRTDEQAENSYVSTVLFQVEQAIINAHDVDQMLETIIHILEILIGIDTAMIMNWDMKTGTYSPRNISVQPGQSDLSQSIHENPDDLIEFFELIRRSNSYQILETSEKVIKKAGGEDPPIVNMTSDAQSNLVFGYPISFRDEFYGILLIVESKPYSQFQQKRIEILSGISQQIGLWIQNNLLFDGALEKEKLQKEIQLTRKIQLTFLPDTLLKIQGWNMAVRWLTARQVGGDFYDYFFLDENNIALIIADVADKGLPASLYMTVTRTLIRAYAKNESSPSAILSHVNEQLLKETPNSLFVTAVLGILTTSSGAFIYSVAGHPLPLIIRSKKNQVLSLQKCGMALGIAEDALLQDKKARLLRGDALLLFSDGITDTINPSGKFYGQDRLVNLLKKDTFSNSEQLLTAIESNIRKFRKDVPVQDDVTMLSISRE